MCLLYVRFVLCGLKWTNQLWLSLLMDSVPVVCVSVNVLRATLLLLSVWLLLLTAPANKRKETSKQWSYRAFSLSIYILECTHLWSREGWDLMVSILCLTLTKKTFVSISALWVRLTYTWLLLIMRYFLLQYFYFYLTYNDYADTLYCYNLSTCFSLFKARRRLVTVTHSPITSVSSALYSSFSPQKK